jgi:hypothetical protein
MAFPRNALAMRSRYDWLYDSSIRSFNTQLANQRGEYVRGNRYRVAPLMQSHELS